MRAWINGVANRFSRHAEAGAMKEPDRHQITIPTTAAVSVRPDINGLDVEAWLDRKAAQLSGDWVFARLAGFHRGDEAAALQIAAASLQPTDELWVEHFEEDLYSSTAMRVRTVQGSVVGYLESAAAKVASRQRKNGGTLRCFVYSVTLTELNLPSSVLLALIY